MYIIIFPYACESLNHYKDVSDEGDNGDLRRHRYLLFKPIGEVRIPSTEAEIDDLFPMNPEGAEVGRFPSPTWMFVYKCLCWMDP